MSLDLHLATTLLHFLWQGAAIALIAWALMTLLRSPRMRYAIGCVGLLLMLAAPVATYVVLAPPPDTIVLAPAAIPSAAPRTLHTSSAAPITMHATPPKPTLAERARATFAAASPYIIVAWLVGIALVTVRHAIGLAAIARLRRRATSIISDDLRDRLVRIAKRLNVRRRIALLGTDAIDAPCVIGWLRPAILWPASAITGLSPLQLDALLAHELAHIRRHDYLVNLLQAFIETLGFYHPAVWWLSGRVRQEREHCCDDVAAELVGDRVGYAEALANMESLRHEPTFSLASHGGSLAQRVQRLLAPTRSHHTLLFGRGGIVLAFVIALLITGQMIRGERPDKATTQPLFDDAALQSLARRDLTIQHLVMRRARLFTPVRAEAQTFGPDILTLDKTRAEIVGAIDQQIAERADKLDHAKDPESLATSDDERTWIAVQKDAAANNVDASQFEDYKRLYYGTGTYYFGGDVSRPGAYGLPPDGMTLTQAFVSGGFIGNRRGKEFEAFARDNEIWFTVTAREGDDAHPVEWSARFAWDDIKNSFQKSLLLHAQDMISVTSRPRAATQPTTATSYTSDGQQHKIAKEDLLEITYADLSGNGTVMLDRKRVTQAGRIRVPYVEEVEVAGLSTEAAQTRISKALHDAGHEATVSLTIVAEQPPADYAITPGDLLRITLGALPGRGDESVYIKRVSNTGKISVSMLGELQAAGLSEAKLEDAIQNKYRDTQMPMFSVNVLVVEGSDGSRVPTEMLAPTTDKTQALTQADLDAAKARISELEAIVKNLQAPAHTLREREIAETDPLFARLLAARESLEAERAKLAQRLGPNSPPIQKLDAQLDAATKQINAIIKQLDEDERRSRPKARFLTTTQPSTQP